MGALQKRLSSTGSPRATSSHLFQSRQIEAHFDSRASREPDTIFAGSPEPMWTATGNNWEEE
jgi:hypothetical protein